MLLIIFTTIGLVFQITILGFISQRIKYIFSEIKTHSFAQ